MKIYLKRDYIIYILLRIASFIVCIIPLGIALFVGKTIGILMYIFHPKRKRIAYANLKAVFAKERPPLELKRILRNTYKNYGQSIIEMMRIPAMGHSYLDRYITVEELDRFSEAKQFNKGIIFLTSHFGNWELSSLKSARHGYPIYVLARPQRLKAVNDFLNNYREKLGCKVIKRGMSIREIVKALRRNEIVGILSDQDVGKKGIFMDLLGRPASHPIGAIKLARDTGATILPAFIIRKKGPMHVIKLEEIITVSKTKNPKADIKGALRRYTDILESYITCYPEQWMWVYTRWKSTPHRRVVVLSDTKIGHLNQSLAVFDIIKRCRQDAGYKDSDTLCQIIEVKYKNRFAQFLLSLFSIFASDACQGCMRCLKICLTEDSYKSLIHTYADIVISCGRSLSAVNIFLSKENNSKNVIVMKPSMWHLRSFDIAIIPKHDRPPTAKNVIITQGAPHLINEDIMKRGRERIRSMVKLSDKKKIGLLIGGNNPEYNLTLTVINGVLDQLEKVLEELDMELLVTTSRRTPKVVEALLKERLGKHLRCRLLVIANEENIENAVGGILALSEFVLVSYESISMVSEAASCKNTIVFELERKKHFPTKHDYAIKDLVLNGYIIQTDIDRLRDVVIDVYNGKIHLKRLDNTQRMYEKLYQII